MSTSPPFKFTVTWYTFYLAPRHPFIKFPRSETRAGARQLKPARLTQRRVRRGMARVIQTLRDTTGTGRRCNTMSSDDGISNPSAGFAVRAANFRRHLPRRSQLTQPVRRFETRTHTHTQRSVRETGGKKRKMLRTQRHSKASRLRHRNQQKGTR